jgi:hypothetical protein
MNKSLFAILLLISLSACSKAFMYFVVGMRELKPESTLSIRKYGVKVGYDVDNHFYFMDSSKIEEIWKGTFPKAYIYNEKGKLVRYLDCFATGMNDLKSFYKKPIGTAHPISDTMRVLFGTDTILNVAPQFITLPTIIQSQNKNLEFEGYAYYIVYFWSKSFGRINKRNGVQMERYIKDHPEHSTLFIKINCDYQKDWGYTKRQLRSM